MRIAIIGRTELLYNIIEQLLAKGHTISCVLTAKEAPEYTKSAEDFKNLADRINVPFRSSAKIKENLDFFSNAEADIAVSVNYPNVIPAEVVNLFSLGILNIHGGDLPRYRGNACQAWAILNGESRVAVCVHKMIGGELDNGDVITREYLEIDHTTKVTKILDWINLQSPGLILTALELLSKDPEYVLFKQSIDPTKALRCYPRSPEDGQINWSYTPVEVLRLINASNKPYSGAFCGYDGKKMIIWDAELVEEFENFCAIPGQVTKIGKGYIEVACCKGKIRINQVEFDSKISTPDFLINSIRKRLT
jgi:methionyl-tRNA formyltransferase